MRNVTPREAEGWKARARACGCVNEADEVVLDRFRVEPAAEGRLKVTLITPVVAGLYRDDLRAKTPPILFDRTPAGEIRLPGR